MVKVFIKQYGPPNSASKGCGWLKWKSIESSEGMIWHESQKKVEESTFRIIVWMRHNVWTKRKQLSLNHQMFMH